MTNTKVGKNALGMVSMSRSLDWVSTNRLRFLVCASDSFQSVSPLLVAEGEQVIEELLVLGIVVAQFAKDGLELLAPRDGARERVDDLVASRAAASADIR